jgi:bisphosphoglycerate-dependent phosphoglycerate mutase
MLSSCFVVEDQGEEKTETNRWYQQEQYKLYRGDWSVGPEDEENQDAGGRCTKIAYSIITQHAAIGMERNKGQRQREVCPLNTEEAHS